MVVGVLVNPPHGHFRSQHLEHVVSEMRKRGAPAIRAYFDGTMWHAREGTHRLRAAKLLGLAPMLISIPWWRSNASLERARYHAARYGHVFDSVEVQS